MSDDLTLEGAYKAVVAAYLRENNELKARIAELETKIAKGCVHNDLVYLEEVIKRRNERIATLEKVAEAATEWFGPSLQDARFETVAIIKALREAGYTYTTQEESK